jgi:hypothetical protein
MGEEKTKLPRKLLVRLAWPGDEPMLVELSPQREFLERCLRLMLICGKIKRTMGGAGQVIVESHDRLYLGIHSESAIHRLISLANVKDWENFKCLWVPWDFYIGKCTVMAGIRRDTTHIAEDEIWFEGTDGSSQMVSVRLGRAWLRRELSAPCAGETQAFPVVRSRDS